MDVDKAIKLRHSVRNFKTTKPANWRDVIKAIDAARLAPLAGNISSIRFVLVTDKDKIFQIAEAAMQPFIADASYIVVVCTFGSQTKTAYGEKADIYTKQQAGAAIENFLLKITDLGLASCWVGAFTEEMVKKILFIPDNIAIEAILPVGYESPPKSSQRTKRILENVLYFNKWKERYMVPFRKVEAL